AEAGAAPEVAVRTEFADTALWVGTITTAKDGSAEVELDMPENLTTWRIKVWGMGHGTRVGEGFADVVTRKDLIVRLQAPRFFVQSDEVVLSANVHNYLPSRQLVRVKLELGGGVLEPLDKNSLEQTVQIRPAGERRVDWRVKVLDEGEAVVRMFAMADGESDAMEMKFPSLIHGMLKMEARSGVIRPDKDRAEMQFTVPAQRRPAQSRLEVRYSPTLAGAMVDALPYLAEYPYGCTEQTLNRFLPTVVTQKILIDMGLDLEAIGAKRANLNAQELGDATDRARQWKRFDRNPVFDQEEVRRMVADGVARLTEMQLSDGGWGWFSGYGEQSYPHTTAQVVHGLQVAKQNDVALVPGMLDKGVEWLRRYQNEQLQLLKNALIERKPQGLRWKNYADNLDALAYMVLVDADVVSAEMNEFLYRDRVHLAVYSLAMYGIALHKQGDQHAKLDMIGRNIGQYLQQDEENQTAWLNLPGGYWWHWYGSEFEAHAYFLKLLSRTNPDGELASRLVKYLLNNRKNATYWNSTRDTALCVEAMADYLRASGEDKPEMTVQVYVGGELKKTVEITPETLFQFDDRFVLEGDQVPAGPLNVELRREGAGPVYFNGYLTNFTLEDFITKAGLEIKVDREYYKLVRVDATQKAAGSRGQVVDQKVEKYERQKLDNLATVQSGDLVEVELVIESKNDYEYLVFEDMKPAGFEPVDLRSGYTGNALGAYVEFRDDRVVMFVRRLARGKHSTSYRMRAETPGKFSALPTKAWAMYAPELKGNSDEIKLNVKD
ncbi:MAG: alpha-2-macroglobulin family protein, partial [Patescibacteria group bacterium]|nr:alpha-2-macroglobulin family protein [Patescibacteria group bacterium]